MKSRMRFWITRNIAKAYICLLIISGLSHECEQFYINSREVVEADQIAKLRHYASTHGELESGLLQRLNEPLPRIRFSEYREVINKQKKGCGDSRLNLSLPEGGECLLILNAYDAIPYKNSPILGSFLALLGLPLTAFLIRELRSAPP